MRFDVARHTIFVALAGSQAHGTARVGSDVDVRGVCRAPLDVRLSLFERFDQVEGSLETLSDALAERVLPALRAHPTARPALAIKTECVIVDLQKQLGLCANANPNALEILFADEHDWLYAHPLWRRLHAERYRFLSKRVQQTFLGYALQQLRKIKTHRAWLLAPPTEKPTRESLGLPATRLLSADDQNRIEQSVAEKIRSYGIADVELDKAVRITIEERLTDFYRDVLSADGDWDEQLREVATRALALPPDVVATLNAEKRYRAAMKQWESFQAWQRERNPLRAELERRHGYDTKHAMHLIRLMRMGVEVLRDGELRVRRHDAAELNGIRDGSLSYEALVRAAEELEAEMAVAAKQTSLPDDVDRDAIDALACELLTVPL